MNAEHIFILPNNKNIILAANQAKALTKDKDIIVIPTKTIPQGISAIINFIPEQSPEGEPGKYAGSDCSSKNRTGYLCSA